MHRGKVIIIRVSCSDMISEERRAELATQFASTREILAKSRSRDILLILTIPAALISIQATVTPADWAFPVSAPSIYADHALLVRAFTSSYVHEGVGLESGHLWGNVFGYLFLMSAIYPLALAAGWRKQLMAASLFYLLVVPFIASQATTILPYSNDSLGFSSVLGAYLGFVPPVLFAAGGQNATERYSASWSIVFVLLTFPIAFYFAPRILPVLPQSWGLIIQFSIGFLVTLLLLWWVVGLEPVVRLLYPGENPITCWGCIVAISGFASLFVAVNEANVVSHFAGYYVGYAVVFTFLFTRDLRDLVDVRCEL